MLAADEERAVRADYALAGHHCGDCLFWAYVTKAPPDSDCGDARKGLVGLPNWSTPPCHRWTHYTSDTP